MNTISKNKALRIVTALSLLLGIFVVVRGTDELIAGLKQLSHARLDYVLAALVLTLATYLFASFAVTYLAIKKIIYEQVFIIQIAGGFANKLVPGGVGGFAINTRFLTKHRHSLVQASSVMSLNALLGLVGHMTIFLVALMFDSDTITQTLSLNVSVAVLVVLCGLLVGAVLYVLIRGTSLKKNAGRFFATIKSVIEHYAFAPKKLALGLLGASMVTLCFVGALHSCALALGIELGIIQTMLVFSAGVVGIAISPTPGGVGGAEAALVAALSATGLPLSQAVSLAILYKLITYWLPIAPGFLAFRYALHLKMI